MAFGTPNARSRFADHVSSHTDRARGVRWLAGLAVLLALTPSLSAQKDPNCPPFIRPENFPELVLSNPGGVHPCAGLHTFGSACDWKRRRSSPRELAARRCSHRVIDGHRGTARKRACFVSLASRARLIWSVLCPSIFSTYSFIRSTALRSATGTKPSTNLSGWIQATRSDMRPPLSRTRRSSAPCAVEFWTTTWSREASGWESVHPGLPTRRRLAATSQATTNRSGRATCSSSVHRTDLANRFRGHGRDVAGGTAGRRSRLVP